MGDVIGGNFVLGDVIGEGGMGVVYKAVQLSLGRTVAVKVPKPELVDHPDVRRRFRAEAIASGQLTHPNIIKIIEFAETRDSVFLAMERVRGKLLADVLLDDGPMPARGAVNLVCQVLAALEEAHDAGIIHADVKCDNVIVSPARDGDSLAQLFDFGLAHFSHGEVEGDGARGISGTPAYMAPELVEGHPPSRESDVYAVGVMLYALLTGTTPFPGGAFYQVLARQLDEEIVPPSARMPTSEHSRALDDVVLRALATDPARRFRDAASFANELRAAFTTTPRRAFARTPTPPPIDAEPCRECDDSERVKRDRAAVARALVTGTPDEVAAAYLDLARALFVDGRVEDAAFELEDGITRLELGPPPQTLWCLLLTQCTLYLRIKDHARALRSARACHEHAIRVRSTIGEARARAMLMRMSRAKVAIVDRARPSGSRSSAGR